MATANDVLRIARGEIGYSRWNDPLPGTKYGRWYANLVGDASFGVSGVPFCAMGASWVFDQAGASCAGFPGAYTPTMLNRAKSEGKTLGNKRDAQPGDIVYFNWDGGVVDHVGFIELNKGDYVQTIEFNTNNGSVARRTRNWNTIEAIVRPNYDGVSMPTPSPSNPQPSDAINEDGWWGPKTTYKAQAQAGTTYDGVISGQDRGDMRKINKGGLQYDTWTIGSGGSQLIRAIQRKVGAREDGYAGVETWTKFQRYLGTTPDGYASGPSDAVREFQRRLNAGTFF